MKRQSSVGKKEPVSKGVIGVDEVGRGPLAGPVTVCAVYVEDEKRLRKDVFGGTVRDSKKLTKLSRVNIYSTISQNRKFNRNIIYAVSSRTAAYIDQYGINRAVEACIRSCMKSLMRQAVNTLDTVIHLDAGLKIPGKRFKQKSFIKGDERYAEIALASILAKVTRDAYMEILAQDHEEYGWASNAGYGTLAHRRAIEKYGITKYHRKSYLKGFQTIR